MTAFILLAIALTGAAIAAVAVPLLRGGSSERGAAPRAALFGAIVIAIGSAGLYLLWSNWSWRAAPPPNSPQDMVARLAWKLERDPQDEQGWLMLGRSYSVLQQLPLALRAYQRADRLAGGKSVEALLGIAETLTLGDVSELDGRAGRLFERALVLEPNSGKALFYGAVLALHRGELPLAKERFTKLLSLGPPQNVRPLLERQIAAIDAKLAAAAPSSTIAPTR